MKIDILAIVLINILMTTVGQVFLKLGAQSLKLHPSLSVSALLSVATNAYLLIGLLLYALGTLIWIYVLSRAELSQVYPMIALGFVLTAVAGFWLFHEPVTMQRIAGIFVICLGVVLIARS